MSAHLFVLPVKIFGNMREKKKYTYKTTTNLMLYVRCLRLSEVTQLLFAELLRGRHRPLTLISPLLLLGTLH